MFYFCVSVSVVSDSPVKLTTRLTTRLTTELTTTLLRAFYKLTTEAYYTVYVPKVSRGGSKNFKFTYNFQINNVPRAP